MAGGLDVFSNIGSQTIGILGKSIGEQMARGDLNSAFEFYRKMADLYGPDILPQLQQLAPQLVGETEMKGGYNDEGRALQLKALSQLEREFSSPDGSPESRAKYTEAQDVANSVARGQSQSAQAQLAQRGMGDSGLSFALNQQANQAGQQQGSHMALEGAANRHQQALAALGAYQQGAGALRGGDWQKFSQTAAAQDAINKFNANMRTDAGRYGNDVRNQGFQNSMQQKGALGGVYDKMSGFNQKMAGYDQQSAEEWTKMIQDYWKSWMNMAGSMGGGDSGGGMGGMMGGMGGGGM